jgi:archaellum component FlaC
LKRKILFSLIFIAALIGASFLIGAFYQPFGSFETFRETGFKTPTISIKPVKESLAPTINERMIIYTGYISLETNDIDGTIAMIRSLADRYGGYVASSNKYMYDEEVRAEIVIRVPKDKFHAAIQEIESYGKVLNENVNSEDITQQYIDLKARLSNLQHQEKRLLEILELAKNVDEILAIEKELERVRGEIESLQGQINYLERNVEMSIISINLTKPKPSFKPPSMNWGEVLETALTGLFTVLKGLIILAISTIPITIIGIIGYHIYKERRKKEVEKQK